VVRRRRDQADARAGVAQPRDHLVDLVSRQLAAFARLRALRDLDLQHLGADEVLGRDAEPARSHLLDLGVALRAVAGRVFASLARVGAGAEPVHGDGKRLVRLGRQGAERHPCAVEARQDVLQRLNVLEGNGLPVAREAEQVADAGGRAVVHQRGKKLVALVLAADDRGLQGRHDVRVVHVVLAAVDVLVQAALLEVLARIEGAPRQRELVLLEILEIRSLDAADRARKAQAHDLVGEPDDLEQLRAAVAHDRRDAHLRHDLEQPLADAAAIAPAQLEARLRVHLHRALLHHVEERLVGHVGIDGRRAVADQAGEMVGITGRPRLDQQVALAAEAGGNEPVVHRTRGQQGVHGNAPADDVAIGEQDEVLAGADRLLGLVADPQRRLLEPLRRIVVQVDVLVQDAEVAHGEDLPQLALRQDRRVEHDVPGVLGRRHEDVALGRDHRLQRHHDGLAQRVDRRVRHLRELLAEVVVGRAGAPRQDGHRRVVAHRADRLALVLGEHADDLVALLGRDVEHLLVEGQRVAVHRLRGKTRVDQVRLEVAHALLEPGLVGMAALQQVVDALGVQQLAGMQVERDHLARAHAALLLHVRGRVVPHADLGGDREVAVAGHHPPRRAQAVAVERTGRVAAIRDDRAGGAVPALEVGRIELVERPQVGLDVVHVLPGRRDEQAHGVHHVEPADQQQLEHVVEALRVGAGQRHQRLDV